MKYKKSNKPINKYLIIALALTLLAAGALSAWIYTATKMPNVKDVTAVKGNTTKDEPKQTDNSSGSGTTLPSPSPSPTPSPTPAGSSTEASKPILSKSSGNAAGSSIPAGVVVEFTCEGTPGAQCDIVLTDQNNANHTLSLGAKTITSNGRGSYFAIWDWSSIQGSWNVVAKSYTSTGAPILSDAQTLEVK